MTTRKHYVTGIVDSQMITQSDNLLPVIKIKLLSIPVNMLVDTGATACILQNSIFKNIGKDDRIKRIPSNATLKSISGQTLNIVGCYMLPINIGSREICHPFHIIDSDFEQSYVGILGYDFMVQNGISLDFERGKMSSNKTAVKFKAVNEPVCNSVPQNFARLQVKCSLQPHETKMVDLATDLPISRGESVLIDSLNRNPAVQWVRIKRPRF